MKHHWSRLAVIGLIGLAAVVAGCRGTGGSESATELKGTVRISGAWALYPMVVKWGDEFHKVYPQVTFDISAGGAGKGMADALGGLVDIGMVSRDIFPEEEARGAFWVPVVKDAVVATVSDKNPVLQELLEKGVTEEVLEGIWISGDITTWGQVVGRPEVTEPIHVYTRSDACGAGQTWAEYLGGHDQEDLKGVAVYGDPGLAEAVGSDRLGIGYNNLNFAYLPTTREPAQGLKIVPFDINGNGSIEEAEDFYDTKDTLMEAIASGVYPSPPARALNVVTLGKPTGLVREFMVWILTEGQRYIEEAGYVPLRQEDLQAASNKLE
jgi:phosphate transport system substrate-binding protein